MRVQLHKPRRTLAALAAVALAATGAITLIGGSGAQAAPAAPGDGTTSSTAGASCWGIKQAYPSSANGVYWLSNATLDRPQQFYCDMVTDGGGWVLVGRGRQGWSFSPFGQGSPNTLRTVPDGTGAFSPAALDSSVIDGLLNGGAVSALPDGIRVERATNTSGTNRQNLRLYPRLTNWQWNFHGGQLLDRVVIDGTTYQGSNTYDTADTVPGQTTNQLSGTQGTRRMFTFRWSGHNNQQGFSFGSGVSGGSSSSTNFLWTYSNEGNPIPFSRVWIRPQIANSAAGFSAIPAAGYPASTLPATLSSRSELAPWGVVGLDHTNETTIEPYNTNVLSLRTLGDRTFVGGRFTGVQNGPSATQIAQPYLAAFNYDGTWIDTFRPVVNGRVWDMVTTPDGKLIIAGDFTSVNGQPNTAGVAALDPQTGAVVPGFKASFANTTGRLLVRALAQRDGIVYAAGSFNRFTGGTWNQITVSSAVSFNASNGTPGTWRPRASGQVVRIRVSQDGTRVLMAGYFTNINGDANMKNFAITDRTTGVPVSGIGAWSSSEGSNSKTYQQAVIDFPNGNVAVGGSEHNLQLWNRDRTQRLDAAVTKQGGDIQMLETFGSTTYVGCHCGNWIYEGTNNYSSPTGFRSIKPINLVGAIDTATWQVDTSWWPSSLKGQKGEGVWAADQDSRGCLWVGGDLNRGAYSGNAATDWLGGFARFCPQDATAPTTPTGLSATTSGADVVLSWGAATDASGTVAYDVYRNDRVIATTYARTFTDPGVTGTNQYTVRAVDARGNRSASPAPISVNGPSPVIATPVAFNTAWKYLADGSDQGTAWRSPSFSDAAWASGNGRLGWGLSQITTTVGTTKPLTTYYRRTFSVADASQVRLLDLKLYELQGAVVYVNGVEAGRLNMPAGPITSATPAAGYLSATDEQALKTVSVPSSLLVNGTNTIAVEVHNVTAGAGRSMFDLQATLYGAGGDAVAPTAPQASATVANGGVDLTWTASTDDVALAGYLVTRDGQPLTVVGPAATSLRDVVDVSVAHTYEVTAFDANGNAAASGTVATAAVADPNLLGFGSTWRWFYAEGGPGDGWSAVAFDDTTWASGPAELGYGDSDEKTVISTAPTPRPLTAYFRTTIDVPNPAAFTSIVANLIRDDGAVLYINGVEVGRDNLPAGPIGFSTPASSIISDRTAEKTPVTFTIPAGALVAGTNTIAVEVHNSDRWSGDLSMDLKLTGQP